MSSDSLNGQSKKRQEGSELLKRKKDANKILRNNGSCVHSQCVRASFGPIAVTMSNCGFLFPGHMFKVPCK